MTSNLGTDTFSLRAFATQRTSLTVEDGGIYATRVHRTLGFGVKSLNHILTLWLFVFAIFVPLKAQQVGSTEAFVREKMGNPQAQRVTGQRTIWMYSDGSKIVFEKGLVVEVSSKSKVRTDSSVATEAPVVPRSQSVSAPTVSVEKRTAPTYQQPQRSEAPPTRPSSVSPSSVAQPRRNYEWLVIGLLGAAVLIIGVCKIWLLCLAFRESFLWGMGSLFIPLVGLIFVISHWDETKKPFLLSVCVGLPCLVMGVILSPGGVG